MTEDPTRQQDDGGQQPEGQQAQGQQAAQVQHDAQVHDAQHAHEQPLPLDTQHEPAAPQADEHAIAADEQEQPAAPQQESSAGEVQEPPVPEASAGEPARAATDSPLVLPEGDEEAVHGTGPADPGEVHRPDGQVAEAQPVEAQVPEGQVAEAQPAEGQPAEAGRTDAETSAPSEPAGPPTPATIPTPASLARSARPGPRPVPRPGPTTGPPTRRPGPETAAPPAAGDAEVERQTRELAERARAWGRVGEDGTVFVRTADGEREVGSYPGASDDEALAFFARKYEELEAQLDLTEQRLAVPEAPVKDVARTLEGLRPTVAEANVVGDLEALQRRLAALDERVVVRRREAEERRAQAKEAARAARLVVVEEAERIAATDPEKMQWKPSGDRLRALFDEWKTAQRSGQRLDKPVEDELWKRFSQARTTFDRHRRAYFSELEKRHGEVKAVKAKIVAEAEALSTSREWGPTSAAFRALMDRWKAAGRASRKDDDALWAQFRAAQDSFFSARTAEQAQVDAEFRGNLEVKERLLVEAEALLPIKDLDAAKRALRGIHERWDAAGKVPRGDLGRVERRLKAVEDAVRQADETRWRRRNPEAKARAEGALGQLEESISGLESDLHAARERGDERAVRTAEEALSARRAWLEQVRQAASEFS